MLLQDTITYLEMLVRPPTGRVPLPPASLR